MRPEPRPPVPAGRPAGPVGELAIGALPPPGRGPVGRRLPAGTGPQRRGPALGDTIGRLALSPVAREVRSRGPRGRGARTRPALRRVPGAGPAVPPVLAAGRSRRPRTARGPVPGTCRRSPPGQPATADRAGAGSALRTSTVCSSEGSQEMSYGVRSVDATTGAVAGSVNHTTLPDSPSGRTPQLSLTAAISASPRPQVAGGVRRPDLGQARVVVVHRDREPCRAGTRSPRCTVCRAGRAGAHWSAVRSRRARPGRSRGPDASSAIAPRRFCGPGRSATAGLGAPPCSACLAG